MFSCRIENKHDFYNTLCEWWTDWKFPLMSIDAIPNNICVVSNEGVDLYAVPVYLSDSEVCWMGFITGNKNSTKELRSGSFCLLASTKLIPIFNPVLAIPINGFALVINADAPCPITIYFLCIH